MNRVFKYEVTLLTPYKDQWGYSIKLYAYGDSLEEMISNVGYVYVDEEGEEHDTPEYRIASEDDKELLTKWYLAQ